ncbi:MAG: hypothetical protein GY771_03605 [bacterium]|nr:hypothetical protein [bacterium]
MRKLNTVVITIITVFTALFFGCSGENGKEGEAIESEHKPPPVEYAVGSIEINDEAKEPSVHLKIAVAPGTAEKDIKRLFAYFEKDRYAEYDIIWVDVYFDIESAKSADVSADFLVASLRVNRPGFIEETYNVEETVFDDEMPEVTLNTEEVIFLGYKGRMFDSPKQARTLLDLIEEKPGRSIYKVTWESPEKCELSYSIDQMLLARTIGGVSREAWSNMTIADIRGASRGMGFGGKQRHGSNYSYSRLDPVEENAEEDTK